jgi:hypothetical protein
MFARRRCIGWMPERSIAAVGRTTDDRLDPPLAGLDDAPHA